VNQPIQKMGQMAVELLLSLLAGQPIAAEHLTLPTSLVVRQSTAPFRTVKPRRGGRLTRSTKGRIPAKA